MLVLMCLYVQIYHVNQCLAYTKGLAEYVGVWDVDELMIPREKGLNIPEVCISRMYVCMYV